jgi:hypothetical protein
MDIFIKEVEVMLNENMPNKKTDIVKQAQDIIDSFVWTEYKSHRKKQFEIKDIVLWIAAGIALTLTLFIYFFIR